MLLDEIDRLENELIDILDKEIEQVDEIERLKAVLKSDDLMKKLPGSTLTWTGREFVASMPNGRARHAFGSTACEALEKLSVVVKEGGL